MITAFYAGLLGLIFVVLTLAVVRLRYRYRVSLGDGGHEILQRRIRAQGNFAETVQLALVLLAFAELQNMPLALVHGLGAALVIGRLSHACAIYRASVPPRMAGMVLTLAVIVITSCWDLAQVSRALM